MEQPSSDFLKDPIYLVDASSFIFRAYYGMGSNLKAPDGTPTQATFGFIQMILALIEHHKPSHVALIWDRPEPTFRHTIYSEYKANRGEPPEDLGVQINNAIRLSDAIGVGSYSVSGLEADDIIASLVAQNPTHSFVVCTGDKDLLQLVNSRVWLLDTMKEKWSNQKAALEKFGVEPEKIRQVQALSGDSVDHIPGAPGVGPKTATELIQQFHDIENVIAEAKKRFKDPPKKTSDALKGKKIEAIAQHADQIRMSLQLVSLKEDAKLPFNLGAFVLRDPQAAELFALLRGLGFHRLEESFKKKLGSDWADHVEFPVAGLETKQAETPILSAQTSFEVKILRSVSEIDVFLSALDSRSVLSLDTETRNLNRFFDNQVLGVSMAYRPNEGAYLAIRAPEFVNTESQACLERVRYWIEHSECEVVCHNAKFDLEVLALSGLELPDTTVVHDSMIAAFLIDPSGSHGLDHLVQKYLNYHMLSFESVTEGLSSFEGVPLERAAFYAAEDAVMTLRLFEILRAELKRHSLTDLYHDMDRPLLRVLMSMERRGIGVDVGFLAELSQAYRADLETIEGQTRQLLKDQGVATWETVNFASPKQMAQVLFEDLKLPVIKKTKTGPSTDVSVLTELAPQHPFPKRILEMRELQKLLNTYVDVLPTLCDHEQRIHTDFSQTTAETGRLASANPNLQNIPIRTPRGARIREAFVARKGSVLMSFDYSQIELRILADMSRDPELVKAFQEGADIHRRTAALIMGKTESEVSSDERRIAKTINFGIIYGQTAFGLAKTLGISKSEAGDFIDKYNRQYKTLKEFFENIVKNAKEKGFVETLCRRRRYLPDLQSKNFSVRGFAERMAINTPIQGTAADLIKTAMIEVERWSSKAFGADVRLLLQVHDELVMEVSADLQKEVSKEVRAIMQNPRILMPWGAPQFSVPLETGVSSGVRWAKS